MRGNRKGMTLLATVLLTGVLMGCGAAGAGKEPVSEPPELVLFDPASSSSTLGHCSIDAGGYSWQYKDGWKTGGVQADAAHPLDAAGMDHVKKLEIWRDSDAGGQQYFVGTEIAQADEVIVVVWDAADIGNSEAESEPVPVKRYEIEEGASFSVELQRDKVYEFVAVWDEEKLKENGFCGSASYTLVTTSPD